MNKLRQWLDLAVVWALAKRTFRHSVESPVAYVVSFFFYSIVGAIFGMQYFGIGQASMDGVTSIAPWMLWFVIPALTMGLISDELRQGTFEHLATLPVRDLEIVLGKFLGFAGVAAVIIGGLVVFPLLAALTAFSPAMFDWGAAVGALAGLYLLCLVYGAMGLFASSLAKNQVVSFIIGMIFCTTFFLVGQFIGMLPNVLARTADFLGVMSHLLTLSRGVWDLRDLFYFLSLIFLFLYFAVTRLSTRRF